MINRRLKCYKLLILLTLLFSCFPRGTTDEEGLRETHRTLMEILHEEDNSPDLEDWDLPNLSWLSLLVKVLLYGGGAVLLTFIGIFIYRFIKRDSSTISLDNLEENPEIMPVETLSSAEWQKRAEDFAEAQNYGKAVVCLHKCSVALLSEKEILEEPDGRTNRELKALLGDHQWLIPFSRLATAAEIILFAHKTADKETWNEFFTLFQSAFGGSE